MEGVDAAGAPPVVSDTSEWDWARDIDCTRRSHFDYDDDQVLSGCRSPILTMFTAMHDADGSREHIHNNTILNWASLGKCVQHILYIEDVAFERLKQTAESRRR